MGARALSITQRQVTAILKGAAAAGVRFEIKAEKGVVKFIEAKDAADQDRVDTEVKGYL